MHTTDLDTLLGRFTAGCASDLNESAPVRPAELGAGNPPADVGTLRGWLTVARAASLAKVTSARVARLAWGSGLGSTLAFDPVNL